METLHARCREAFNRSRKLKALAPSPAQLENVAVRLRQIFTPDELERMDDQTLTRQVERVWPIAQYVDRKL